MKALTALAGMAVVGSCLMPAHSTAEACKDLTPDKADAVQSQRLINAEDIVRIRDIGPVSYGDPRAGLLRVSPDGRRIAFQIRRADPATNSYCFGMYILDLVGEARPTQVNSGGEFIPLVQTSWGFAVGNPNGEVETVTPKWSPDGQSIAFLRRDDGVTQVWRARVDGSLAEPLTRFQFDVEDFEWLSDGHSLVVTGRPDFLVARDAIMAEGRRGYVFDDRFMPSASSRPFPSAPIRLDYFVIGTDGFAPRAATDDERTRLERVSGHVAPTGALMFVQGAGGAVAWVMPTNPKDVGTQTTLHIKVGGAAEQRCNRAECDRISDLWFDRNGLSVAWLRHERGSDQVAIFRSSVENIVPKQVLVTDGVLIGCQMAETALICGEEAPLHPRRLVRIDLQSGSIEPIFDPNPEFSTFRLGTSQRLHWKNSFGIDVYGDLLVPPDHQPGQRHPLILVGYNARGFMRGGTGDDYPMLLYAAHGYAVLSYQAPLDIGYFRGAKTWADMDRIARLDWIGFKSNQSAIEAGAQRAVSLGIADPERMGLTGLSYGSTIAQYTLVNGTMFRAAVVSNCCEDPAITHTLVGPSMSRLLHAAGYPSIAEDGTNFWKPISFRLNASRMKTPLLMQLPDREYLGALESYTALRAYDNPVELAVFPDEYHIKWQPAHRLATYSRSLDWFDFWLRGVKDPDPLKLDQYRRWEKLRDHQDKELSASPGQ